MVRKGISVGIVVVVAIVVMLVIALSVVSVVNKSMSGFSGNSKATIDTSALSIRCQAELATRCSSNTSRCICLACKSCPEGTMCP
ncbi:MAG: hypothetical protein ABIG84_03520 [archaeon]